MLLGKRRCYFADPWLFNCRNDDEQRAIWKAEQRAIRWAMSQGVVVVAGQDWYNTDLSKQNIDTISPDYPDGSAITGRGLYLALFCADFFCKST